MSAIDVRERLRPFGISFEKSLDDLIKGIRARNSDSEKLSEFFDKSILECKKELKTTDLELKSSAILKLAYLEMYGFDMSWCAFHILEVMSSPKFQHKRIGYLAAIQILQRQNNDDALMLMTNLLKKDLNSVHFIETSLAISGIAAVVSSELALDICDDMAKMLSHSKPLIRKKAILAMFKIFLKNPEALKVHYSRIVEKLDDPDESVVSATVNVICELAHANPSNYIELAPRLYAMLKESNNNWMVIKLLKLFTSLSLVEPRLKNRLLPEIKSLIVSTKALSVVYECINLILKGNILDEDDIETAELIINKLIIFFESSDQNLKYVGLLAFIKTCKIHQNLIQKHDKIILTSIYDNDVTIRETSLEIVDSLVNENNIIAIVTRLTVQLLPYTEQQEHLHRINEKIRELRKNHDNEDEDDEMEDDKYTIGFMQQPIVVSDKYKYLLINKIIRICFMNNYKNIPNFRWYLGVLTDILKLNIDNKISNVDKIISEQLVDIALRVPSIRPQLVELCLQLCGIPEKLEEELLVFKNGLSNCMWIIGEYYEEYIEYDENDSGSDNESDDENDKIYKYSAIEIIEALSKQKTLKLLGNINFDSTITIYIQAVSKLVSKFCSQYGDSAWSATQFEAVKFLIFKTLDFLTAFQCSPNFQVQERALMFIEVLRLVEDSIENQLGSLNTETDSLPPPLFLTKGYNQLFSSSIIKPVSAKSQQRVLPPSDLDLNESIEEEACINFQILCNKLKLEELELDFSNGDDDDDYDDDDEEENATIEDLLTGQIHEDEYEQLQINNKKKDNHEGDPYYIDLDSTTTKITHTEEPNENLSVENKEHKKKSKKPKKYKKEQVLIIDEGDDEHNDFNAKSKATSKFTIDSSKLASINLKEPDLAIHTISNEYKVEDIENNADNSKESKGIVKFDNIPIIPSAPPRRKPKKKVKKKVATIE